MPEDKPNPWLSEYAHAIMAMVESAAEGKRGRRHDPPSCNARRRLLRELRATVRHGVVHPSEPYMRAYRFSVCSGQRTMFVTGRGTPLTLSYSVVRFRSEFASWRLRTGRIPEAEFPVFCRALGELVHAPFFWCVGSFCQPGLLAGQVIRQARRYGIERIYVDWKHRGRDVADEDRLRKAFHLIESLCPARLVMV